MRLGTRIRGEFVRRLGLEGRWSLWEPSYLFIQQDRERAILRLLDRHGFRSLTGAKVLEIGCGSGFVLGEFIRFGLSPSNAVGVDTNDERIATARERFPQLDFRVANAAEMPFPDQTFDLVLAFTLFTSIPDPDERLAVADDVQRVLRPGGALLWYDYWINPTNPKTRALGLAEIRRLFGCEPVEAQRVTLAPPLARMFASRSWFACELLSKVPPLRTHWLALVRV
jgi:ubiquinone/menaquinone biosynthesis C-methylase UbiE